MFGAVLLVAGVALGAYDRVDYDSIYAPRVTGVQPFYALRRLTACADGEIRHYGHAFVTGAVRNVYVASRDRGLTWKTFFTEPGDPEAMVKSPVSGDWLTVSGERWGGPLEAVRSKIGPGDVHAVRTPLDVGRFTFHRQPVYFPVNRRWIVTGGHSATHPMLLISSDDAQTWHRVDVTNVVSTAGQLVGHDKTYRWDNKCCEPTIYEKKDGTLVMYARTAFDHPYVYRSTDGGETWSAPEEVPEFWMSNTMPTFHRLKDGRLLFLWNNCQPLPRRDPAEYGEFMPGKGPLAGGGELVFTNRDVLHAAISEDDGETWIGCREVLLNPIRNNADLREQGNFPSAENDKSVHQSQVLELEGGKILVAAGQNPAARRLFLFDPKWLYETERHEDFRHGLDGLSNHLFLKSLSGNARGWAGHCAWNRLSGAVMRRDPDTNPTTKRESLNLARIPDPRLVTDRQGVAWNFPVAHAGCVELECRLEGREFYVALNDHWLAPADELNFNDAPVVFKVDPEVVPAKKWISVAVCWEDGEAMLSVDGRILERRAVEIPRNGLSYLHLRATVSPSDPDGTYFHGFHMRKSMPGHPSNRRVTSLDGAGWLCDGEPVTVPHTWNALDAADGPGNTVMPRNGDSAASTNSYVRKCAKYSRKLPSVKLGRRYFIRFEGASVKARVCVNQREVGRHVGAFTAFTFDITDALIFGGDNNLEVEVDNRLDEMTQPMSADFSVYGGLYRSVWLIETDRVCINPLDSSRDGVRVDADPDTGRVTARVSVLGGTNEVHRFAVDNWQLWSPENPKLYSSVIRIEQDGCLDEIPVRFAFRKFEFREDGFYLNGKKRQLRGVNRHQDRCGKGWAVSAADEVEDLKMIKGIGADALRTAHYPQSQHVYDLCDELGLVCWVEYPNVNRLVFTDAFESGMRAQVREMVLQLYNHPSIAMWSIANELHFLNKGWQIDRKKTEAMLARTRDLVRSLDCGRAIVLATQYDEPEANSVFGIVDQVGFNRYPGWYYGGTMRDLLDVMFKNTGRRILAMTEYGVGANVLQHDDPAYVSECCSGDWKYANGPWHPEEYQAYRMHDNLMTLQSDSRIWGHFVWAMFDFGADRRTEGERHGINDKGLVAFDHKTKKDAYFLYQANWTTNRILHLVGQRMTTLTNATMTVMGVSNVGSVELKVNGESHGELKPDDTCAVIWPNIPLKIGENRIELVSGNLKSCAVWNRKDRGHDSNGGIIQ